MTNTYRPKKEVLERSESLIFSFAFKLFFVSFFFLQSISASISKHFVCRDFDYPSLVTGVLEEAEFYNITSLIKLIKDKIRERDCKTSQVCKALIRML